MTKSSEHATGFILELLAGSQGIPPDSAIWQHFTSLSEASQVAGISKTYRTQVDQEPNQAMLLSWVQRKDILGFVCSNQQGQLLWGYPGSMGNLGGHMVASAPTTKGPGRRIYTLVSSTRRGYYALDTPSGRVLAFGDLISIEVATDIWIDGIIDHSVDIGGRGCYNSQSLEEEECGHYFISSDGSRIIGLCTGMKVRLQEGEEVYWLERKNQE